MKTNSQPLNKQRIVYRKKSFTFIHEKRPAVNVYDNYADHYKLDTQSIIDAYYGLVRLLLLRI